MVGAIIKVIIGLFIWLVLPSLIIKKQKKNKKSLGLFIGISCKIIGIAIIVLSILSFIQSIISA
jgi:hypothetical protein